MQITTLEVILVSEPTTTQGAHPWRATARTVFAIVVALLTLLPVIAATAGIGAVPAVVQVLAVAATITRVLALPGVEDFLQKYLPFLAADTPTTE